MKRIRFKEASKRYNSLGEFWQNFFYDSNIWKTSWKMLAPDYFYLDKGNRFCRMKFGAPTPDTLTIETDVTYIEVFDSDVKAVYADRKGISIHLKSGGFISVLAEI